MVYNYETLEAEVGRHGYEVVQVKQGNGHGIYVVLAHSDSKKEYVTWIYNAEANGLFSGNYFMYWFSTEPQQAFEKAYADYKSRK